MTAVVHGFRILDLGCGPGHFMLCMNLLGHKTVGCDIPNEPIFDALNELFGTKRVLQPIIPYKELPLPHANYEIIHADDAAFHELPSNVLWSPEHWSWFIGYLRDLLAQNGRAILHINAKLKKQGMHPGSLEFLRLMQILNVKVINERTIIFYKR